MHATDDTIEHMLVTEGHKVLRTMLQRWSSRRPVVTASRTYGRRASRRITAPARLQGGFGAALTIHRRA
jgi:hypothetical protein